MKNVLDKLQSALQDAQQAQAKTPAMSVDVKQSLRESGIFKEELTSRYVRFEILPKASIYVNNRTPDRLNINREYLHNFPNDVQLYDFIQQPDHHYTEPKVGRDHEIPGQYVQEVIDIIRGKAEPEPAPASNPNDGDTAHGPGGIGMRALNTILYGPPGTGKTYLTAPRCVEICDRTGRLTDDRIRERYAEIRKRYKELVGCGRVEFVTFHQSYGYEEFVEGLRPAPNEGGQIGFRLVPTPGVLKRIAERARGDLENAYVLVIDEINRANISKVMGELITLLEEDKREGALNEVAVTLPHSGDEQKFTLPPNLHILGTMNTADRSIALIDTALRRRFHFEEMAPKPELLSVVNGIDLPAVLKSINDRLEYLIDRDHLIGHAWLMNASTKADVDDIVRRKIIPLVAEYFYDDWRKVRAVLGGTDDFVRGERLAPPAGIDEEDVEERFRWTVRDDFAADAYRRLISGQSGSPEAHADA